jgi:hypothetical protein
VNQWKPQELVVASSNHHSWLGSTKSRLNLGFVAQPRNRPWLLLVVLATMQPALDSTGHRVPQTKPTCLLYTWRPHWPWPFALVLHLHQQQLSHNLHLHYLATSQSTPRYQSLITLGITIHQSSNHIKLMVTTSTRSGPSVHLTITTTFIIYMVISSTHYGPSIHLTKSIIQTRAHLDRIVWIVFSLDPVFDFAIYVMQVCFIFYPTPSSTYSHH